MQFSPKANARRYAVGRRVRVKSWLSDANERHSGFYGFVVKYLNVPASDSSLP
jgi:hypothetical protein